MANRVIYTRPYDAEVEYLESDKNQKILTGIKPDSECSMEVNFMIKSLDYTEISICGCWDSWQVNGFCLNIRGRENSTQMCWGSGYGASVPAPIIDEWYHCLMTKGTQKLTKISDGSTWTKSRTQTFVCNTGKVGVFAINNSAHGDAIVSYFKLSKGNTILFEGIPVRVGNIGYMYDKVSGKLFGNRGTGNFILGPDVANPVPNIRRVFRFGNKRFIMPMPYDSKIEYLESTGTQWIDTVYKPNTNTRTVGQCYFNSFIGSKANYVFGVFAKPNNYGFNVGSARQFFNVPWGSTDGIPLNGLIPQTNKDYEFDISKTGYKINGTSYGIPSTNLVNSTKNMYLFWSNGTSASGINGKIYFCKIYNDNTLVRDFIPVRKNGIGYMYDRVSGRLFGNAGTGQFILGNDIN